MSIWHDLIRKLVAHVKLLSIVYCIDFCGYYNITTFVYTQSDCRNIFSSGQTILLALLISSEHFCKLWKYQIQQDNNNSNVYWINGVEKLSSNKLSLPHKTKQKTKPKILKFIKTFSMGDPNYKSHGCHIEFKPTRMDLPHFDFWWWWFRWFAE